LALTLMSGENSNGGFGEITSGSYIAAVDPTSDTLFFASVPATPWMSDFSAHGTF